MESVLGIARQDSDVGASESYTDELGILTRVGHINAQGVREACDQLSLQCGGQPRLGEAFALQDSCLPIDSRTFVIQDARA